MTTAGACFINEEYITMLWPFLWDDDNWQSMLHTLWMNNRALYVFMRGWQLTEHNSYLRGYHHILTVVMRRWQLTKHVLYLSNYHCFLALVMRGWQHTEHESYLRGYYHILTVVLRRWQLTEQVFYLRDEWPCSVHCHEAKTSDEACFIDEW